MTVTVHASRVRSAPRSESVEPFTRMVALAAMFLLGVNQQLALGVSTATIAAAALFPSWYRVVPRYRGAQLLGVFTGLALLSGYVLSALAEPSRNVATDQQVRTTILVLTALLSVYLILWARRVLPLWQIAWAYGVGALISALPQLGASPNLWKYQIGFPIAVILLGTLDRYRRNVPEMVALVVLAGIGLVAESRSFAGLCLLSAGLLAIQRLVRSGDAKLIRRTILPVTAALVFAGYHLFTSLALSGAIGEELQIRSTTQAERAGSLISGGRPEWAATWQLMTAQPMGHGLGVQPTAEDVLAAKVGLQSVGLPTRNNGYIDNYMFGDGFELHSITADFWSAFGLAGLVLAATMTVLLVHSLVHSLANGTAKALVVLTIVTSLWFLAFGPIYSNLPDVAVALGLALLWKDSEEKSGVLQTAVRRT